MTSRADVCTADDAHGTLPRADTPRIGPNSITQLATAIESRHGADRLQRVFEAAGLGDYLASPPQSMVDEQLVIRLHQALRKQLEYDDYRETARLAGRLTGDYLLAHRIPAPVCRLLPHLPAALAARILTRAITRHAWTFVGSGAFATKRERNGLVLVIENSPLARDCSLPGPGCDYYAGTFEQLYRRLTRPGLRLREKSCIANGAPQCRFEFD